MPTASPRQGIPIPVPSDDPNITDDLNTIVLAVEKKLFATHTTTAARDTATPSPTDGMVCYITGTNTMYVYQDTGWVTFPPVQPAITSGTTVPANTSGANGDVFFKV